MKGTPYADRPARLNGKRGPSERAWCPWGWPMLCPCYAHWMQHAINHGTARSQRAKLLRLCYGSRP